MHRYAARRAALMIPVLLGVSIVTSLSVRLLPGDAALALLGPEATPESISRVRTSLGLDRPWPEQYLAWISGVFKGDWGHSLRNGFKVSELAARHIGATVELGLASLLLGVSVGIPLGLVAAVRRDTWLDRVISLWLTASISMPAFAIGTLLILFFAVRLHWLPSSGYVPYSSDAGKNLSRLILPALALSVNTIGDLGRITRASMLATETHYYVHFAKAKGLPARIVLWRHRLRNALNAIVSVSALEAGYLLAGTVLVETLFGWPGVGLLLSSAIFERDYPVIQLVVMLNCAVFLVLNLSGELITAWIDPRVNSR